MQMCPYCDKVYDPTEYSRCPYCSDELEFEPHEEIYKDCPNCGSIMYWDEYWECIDCGKEIYTGEDDNDGVIEHQGK